MRVRRQREKENQVKNTACKHCVTAYSQIIADLLSSHVSCCIGTLSIATWSQTAHASNVTGNDKRTHMWTHACSTVFKRTVSGDNAFLNLNPDFDLILTLKPSVSISFSLRVIEFVPIRDFERLISHTPNAQIKNLTQNLIVEELFAYVVRSQLVKCDQTTPTYRNAVALEVYYTDLTLLDS